jgi:CheY-like chemotaxis protein
LFDEFQSVDLINTEKMTCAGFQLALVKKLVTIMNGSIKVESQIGKGTKFKIELPAEWVRLRPMLSFDFTNQPFAIPTAETRIATMPDKIIEETSSNLNLALVVDDNATNVFVLQKMLKLLGVESEKAMNGRECIDKVQLASYSIILMDINMPVMNGIEASKELMKMYLEKKIVACPPIIAVTAQEGFEIVQKCESIGIRKCIPKPVKKSELSEILKELGIIKA